MVIIAIGACAKFTIRVERQISTSARAKAEKTAPRVSPLRSVLSSCIADS